MFVHIGNDHVIQSKDIVTIVDAQLIESSTIMDEMLKSWKKDKKLAGTSNDAKAIVITPERIYFSTLSVTTLQKRSSMISSLTHLDDYSEEITD